MFHQNSFQTFTYRKQCTFYYLLIEIVMFFNKQKNKSVLNGECQLSLSMMFPYRYNSEIYNASTCFIQFIKWYDFHRTKFQINCEWCCNVVISMDYFRLECVQIPQSTSDIGYLAEPVNQTLSIWFQWVVTCLFCVNSQLKRIEFKAVGISIYSIIWMVENRGI